jgi:hypothetical protein
MLILAKVSFWPSLMSLSLHFLEREKTGSGVGLLLCVSSLPCTKEIESNEEHRIRREGALPL